MIHAQPRHHRFGISLVELMISISIMAIVFVIVGAMFISSSRFATAEQLRIDVGQNANRALSTLDEVLRQGKTILASASYNSTTYTTGGQTLVLTTPSLLATGQTSPTEDDTWIIYLDATDPNNQVIRLITAAVGADSTRTVGTRDLVQGVKDVYFRYATDTPTASESVTVAVTTQKTITNRPFTSALILNVTLRNHP